MELQLNNLKPTKSDVKTASDYIVSKVESGEESALNVAIWIKSMEELIKSVREGIVDHAVSELDKHSGKATVHGANIERIEAGVKYNYSDDITWNEMKIASDTANEVLKNREEMLKKIPAGHQLVNEDGEVFVGPTKTSTTTYKVTLSKS